jgi:hypothetical protein
LSARAGPASARPAELAAGIPRRLPNGEAEVKTILVSFTDGPQARFVLLWDEAPETCRTVTACLPLQADCFHAIYSGTIVAFLLDETVVAPVENATTCVLPGDLLFTHYDVGKRHGHSNALSEVYWPYDRYARPTIPGEFIPIAASVFGSYAGSPADWAVFADRCKQLRFRGTETVAVSCE